MYNQINAFLFSSYTVSKLIAKYRKIAQIFIQGTINPQEILLPETINTRIC